MDLHIEMNNKQGQIECKFKDTLSLNSLAIDMYHTVTGNLAFQTMALVGKELVAT